MKFLWEQGMTKSLNMFDNGCMQMHCCVWVLIYCLLCYSLNCCCCACNTLYCNSSMWCVKQHYLSSLMCSVNSVCVTYDMYDILLIHFSDTSHTYWSCDDCRTTIINCYWSASSQQKLAIPLRPCRHKYGNCSHII